MTKYRGYYLPVAARREVIRLYVERRTGTSWSPFAKGPLPPLAAMRSAVHYCGGWLAAEVAFPGGRDVPGKTVKDRLDQYRAAQFYTERMYPDVEGFDRRALAGEIR